MPFSRVTAVSTPPRLLPIASKASEIVNTLDFGANRDFVVHLVDKTHKGWESLPFVWHTDADSTLVVNAARLQELLGTSLTHPEIRNIVEALNVFVNDASGDGQFRSFLADGKLNPTAVAHTHRTAEYRLNSYLFYGDRKFEALLMGLVLREAAYSVFSESVRTSPWFKAATPNQRNIIRVFEEIRLDRQLMTRYSYGYNEPADNYLGVLKSSQLRSLTRLAVAITSPPGRVIDDIVSDGGATLSGLALQSSLVLGREHFHLALKKDVEKFRSLVEAYIGEEFVVEAESIWKRYTAISQASESEVMPLIKEWEALFPSSADGSDTGSSIANPDGEDEAEGEPGSGDGSGEGEGEDGEGSGEGSGSGENEGDDGDDAGKGDGKSSSESGDGEADAEGSGRDGGKKARGDEGAGEVNDGGKDEGDGRSDGGERGRGEFEDYSDEPLENVEGTTIDGHGQRGSQATGEGFDVKGGDIDVDDPGKRKIGGEAFENELRSTVEESKTRDLLSDATDVQHEHDVVRRTPSRESFKEAKHRKAAKTALAKQKALDTGREWVPNPADRKAAEGLTKVLRTLATYDRGKFLRSQLAPPGRMNSRAAVQQAAERTLNLPQNARPWKRVVRTVDTSPPLSVGIMVDVSGSMGWAETLVARLTWVVQHAASTVNGRVAACSFGDKVTVTLRPGERLENAQVVKADGGSEAFDNAMGTLDTMLQLENGDGARVVVIVSDGQLVRRGEKERAKQWCDALAKSGVTVLWVSPRASRGIPASATMVSAEELYDVTRRHYWSDDAAPVEAEVLKLVKQLGRSVTRAVEEGKRSRR